MDEARIQEIVDRVIARIGEVPETPLEAVRNPPSGYVAPAPVRDADVSRARRREVDIPRGRRGVFPDVDAAVKAARRAHAQNEAAPREAGRRGVDGRRETWRNPVP